VIPSATGTGTVYNCSIISNVAEQVGAFVGGIRFENGTCGMYSTIISANVADNNSAWRDHGSILTVDHSVWDGTYAGGDIMSNNKAVTDVRVGPLADNGGVTKTHSLLRMSAARAAGSNPLGLLYDQRGAGYPRILSGAINAGAFEDESVGTIFMFK
jgi:hypothetical protein